MKEKFHTFNQTTKGFAIPIIILCILAGGLTFFASPIWGICGAVELINGNFNKALPSLQVSIISTAFNFSLGGLMLANAAIDVFSPVPAERTKENTNHPCWKRRNAVWWISIIGLILLVLAGWISAVVAFQNIETNTLISSTLFIFLHSVGMLIFSIGGLGELIYGKN